MLFALLHTKRRWLDAVKDAKPQPVVKPLQEMVAIVNRHRDDLYDQKVAARDAALAIERDVNALLAKEA